MEYGPVYAGSLIAILVVAIIVMLVRMRER